MYYGYEETMLNSILKDYVFINPNFVTETIYQILDEENVQENGGKFTFQQIEDSTNTTEEANLFLALMQSPNFELIFYYQNYYYASQFLPETNEIIESHKEDLNFSFALRFPHFYSPSFIKRFITRYGVLAPNSAFSRNEIIIEREHTKFYIATDIKKELILIKTETSGKKHRFIRKIYDTFLEFAESDQNIEVSFDNKRFAPLKHIEKYKLKEFDIERLFEPLNYEAEYKGNKIEFIGNGNIVLQDTKKGNIEIHMNDESTLPKGINNDIKEILKKIKEIDRKISRNSGFDVREQIMEKIESSKFFSFKKK